MGVPKDSSTDIEISPFARGVLAAMARSRRPLLAALEQRDVSELRFVFRGNVGSDHEDLDDATVCVTDSDILMYSKQSLKAARKTGIAEPAIVLTFDDIRAVRVDKGTVSIALNESVDITIAFLSQKDAQSFVAESNPRISDRAVDSSDEEQYVDCVVVASHGHNAREADQITLQITDGMFRLLDGSGRAIDTLEYSSLVAVESGGPGAVQSGGGWGGGGFGIEGFALGVAGAALLNKLSTRRGIVTVARLTTDSGEIELFTDRLLPDQLDSMFAPARLALRRREQQQSVQPTSTADEIAKLAQLHRDGVLTEDEFRTAKARLLR